MIELRLQQRKDEIAGLHSDIQLISKKLEDLNNHVIGLTQDATKQALFIKEWKKALTELNKLFIECAGVYDSPDALDDLLFEVTEMIESNKTNFDSNADKPNRFVDLAIKQSKNTLNPTIEVKTIEPEKEEIVIPSQDDDQIVLNAKQVEVIISNYTMVQIESIKDYFGTRASRIDSIASAVATKKITHSELINATNNNQIPLAV